MKTICKVSIYLLLLSLPFSSKANPIIVEFPQVFISELSFITSNDWTLELEMFCNTTFFPLESIDSVVIQTNQGNARILNCPFVEHSLFLVNSDCLSSPLVINTLQDTIRIITYLNNVPFCPSLEHQLAFGYPGSPIPVLFAGQSVCTWEITYGYPLCFYKDNSPTIGFPNDTVGATATLHGMLYDYQNHLITSPVYYYCFSLSNNVTSYVLLENTYYITQSVFGFDNSGYYTTQVFSGNRSVNIIDNLFSGGCPYGFPSLHPLSCESFQLNSEPGQTLEQDIHLTDTAYLVCIKESPFASATNLNVVCAPNPFSSFMDFYLSSSKAIVNTEIQLFNMQGLFIKSIPVNGNSMSWSGRVTKEELGKAGIYSYAVNENGRKIKSGQIICQ
ncbi:MAG: hypothetical protein ACOYMF_16220 [Bacteroidales bacterium]